MKISNNPSINKYPKISDSHILTESEMDNTIGGCCSHTCKRCDSTCKRCDSGHKNGENKK